ncbi:FMN-binding protein [bacterium]|nr:FMN-binding protein [bacterium]
MNSGKRQGRGPVGGMTKLLAGIIAALALLVGGLGAVLSRQAEQRLDAVPVTRISAVEDGIYEGEVETALVKVIVLVTVADHQIRDIQLTRHENGRGAPAEAMLAEMVRQNTSEVDTVSGATMSSKTIRAAVRNALAKGRSGAQEGQP